MALRRIATALLVAGLVTAQVAHAQVTLNFVNADIDQVAQAIGAATGKTIIVDPRVKGQLNLVSENPVPEEQALKTLQSALRMQGFALVQDHGVLKVVPEADAKLQGVPTYVGNAPTARGDQVITQVFAAAQRIGEQPAAGAAPADLAEQHDRGLPGEQHARRHRLRRQRAAHRAASSRASIRRRAARSTSCS